MVSSFSLLIITCRFGNQLHCLAMHESLFQYIEAKSEQKLTEEERELIKSKFLPKRLRKRQYFLQEGDVSKYVAFIVKGSSRMFSVDDNGHEHIVRFGLESWWL